MKLKVVVCGHDQKFWNPIQAYLEKTNLFEFREDFWNGHNNHDKEYSKECLNWADIIIAEWALGNAVYYSKRKKPNQRLIIRLHLQERNTIYPAKLKIESVDKIVFVSNHLQQEVNKKFHIPFSKTCVIPNFVDFNKYNKEKVEGSRFNLGMIGIVPLRKRMDLAVTTLEELLKIDDRYKLFIKGPNPASYPWLMMRSEEKKYYLELLSRVNASENRHRVIFDPPGDDVDLWFKKIGFILSPSDFESFHMAIAEGMCSSTIPIVWDWEGSREIYKHLLTVKSPKQASEQIHFLNSTSGKSGYSLQSSQYVKENFDVEFVITHWKKLLTDPINHKKRNITNNKKAVVMVWCIRNWPTFHRSEMLVALAQNLNQEADVLLIEPGTNYKAILSNGWDNEDTLNKFIEGKPVQLADNLYRIRLIFDGIPDSMRNYIRTGSTNKTKFGRSAKHISDKFFGKDKKIIHWFYKPDQVHKAYYPEGAPHVFEVYDDYTFDFGSGELIEAMDLLEKEQYPKADHVFFTSDVLHDRKKSLCKTSSVISNGVNISIFKKYRYPKPDKYTLQRKTVGYLGNLSDFFDWSLVLKLARLLPEVDFNFHGNIEIQQENSLYEVVNKLKILPNTYFTGLVSRDQGAAAIARYDCLIIPFVNNPAMDAVNPLKLWEYLSVGRPVISSRMQATKSFNNHIYFAGTPEEWVETINKAISEDSTDKYKSRCAFAEKYSWVILTTQYLTVINKLIAS